MSEKGILFKADMIRAIQEGRKTQTRRIILPQPHGEGYKIVTCISTTGNKREEGRHCWAKVEGLSVTDRGKYFSLRYQVSDLLYHKTNYFTKKADATLWLRVTEVKDPHRIQDISEEDCIAEGIEQKWTCINPAVGSYAPLNNIYDDFHELWNSINTKPKPVYKTIDGKKVITHYVSYPWEDIQETREYRGKPLYVRGNPFVFPTVFERVER